MGNSIRRALSLILMMAVLLPSAARGGEAETGGYVENAIPLDVDYVRSLFVRGDEVYMLGPQYPEEGADETDADYGARLLLFKDGEVSRVALGNVDDIDIHALCVEESGAIALLGIENDVEAFLESVPEGKEPDWQLYHQNRERYVFTRDAEGNCSPLGAALSGDYQRIHALPGGGYALQNEEGVVLLDAGGAETGNIRVENTGAAFVGDTAYMLESSTKAVSYNLLTGEKIEEIPEKIVGNVSDTHFIGLAADSAGNLYAYDMNGAYRYAKGAEYWEKILGGMSSVFGRGYISSENFGADDAGNIYAVSDALVARGDEDAGMVDLYQYAWSDAFARTGDVLRIAGISDQELIRAAANEFQRMHPEIRVEYDIYGTGYAPGVESFANVVSAEIMESYQRSRVVTEDAVKALNTEILAGNAPDIWILDGLPLWSYAEDGYLMDLTEWAAGRDTDGTWLPNIVAGFRDESGALPCLPLSFSAQILWGDRSALENIKTLRDISDIAMGLSGEEMLWPSRSQELMTSLFYPICMMDWVNAEGDIDFSSPVFADFLTACKIIQDALPETPDYARMTEEEIGAENEKMWADIMEGRTPFYSDALGRRQENSSGQTIMRMRGDTPGILPLPSQSDNVVYYPQMLMGVSSHTDVTDLAYEFLDTLLSYESQSSGSMYAVPVNAEAFAENVAPPDAEALGPGASPMIIGSGADALEVPLETITPETSAMFADIVASLNTPAVADWTLFTMFFEETLPFMEGGRDLDSTVSALNSRARIYLME